MTREAFHALLIHPRTGPLLDRLLEANQRTDAEIEEQRIRARNEAIYVAAVRASLHAGET